MNCHLSLFVIATETWGQRQKAEDKLTRTMTWPRPRKKSWPRQKDKNNLDQNNRTKTKRLRDEGARDEGDRKKNRKYGRRRGPSFQKSPIVFCQKKLYMIGPPKTILLLTTIFPGNKMCTTNYDVTTKRLCLFAHSPFINVFILHLGQTLNLQGSVQRISQSCKRILRSAHTLRISRFLL